MAQLHVDVLLDYRTAMINAADQNNVLLNHLLNHLRSKRFLNVTQEEHVLSKTAACDRMSSLLDFLSSEGQKAFEELCKALADFGTEDKEELAASMLQSLREKQVQNLRSPGGRISDCIYWSAKTLLAHVSLL
jgi:Caspase recruitment domain